MISAIPTIGVTITCLFRKFDIFALSKDTTVRMDTLTSAYEDGRIRFMVLTPSLPRIASTTIALKRVIALKLGA
jgi:hypothetical protein